MKLLKQVAIVSGHVGDPKTLSIDKLKQLTLFEAVRTWTDDERAPFDIVDEGKRLTQEQIQEIVHSSEYKEQLLAFDERR